MKNLLITIDGPAGSGKSTLCRLLAQKLGLPCLDTGAMYRAVSFAIREKGKEGLAGDTLRYFLRDLRLEIRGVGPEQRVWVDSRDITPEIRRPEITRLASELSARTEVREVLTEKQRVLAERGGLVAEGRDMGTVVFPQAPIKFFLLASLGVRAERRFQELSKAGYSLTRSEVEREMDERDRQDSQRVLAPLRPADEAVIIDTSRLTIEDVLDKMLSTLRTFRKIP